ncbi:MAG: T9SS type A sorting domain-containing protein [Flavobacteriales bacterium]|nr:T9SS type A sorting domain-containing protein [Flavobacteriales bacterium]MCB9166605.1 T9SS type A sorting domain-containing protein [Flavobacteriales bacterium]
MKKMYNVILKPRLLLVVMLFGATCAVQAQSTVTEGNDRAPGIAPEGVEKSGGLSGGLGSTNNAVHVYPNPFQNVLNVQVPIPNCIIARIQLSHSVLGLLLSQNTPYQPIMTVNTANLPSGTYVLTVYDDNMEPYLQKKVVKDHFTGRH